MSLIGIDKQKHNYYSPEYYFVESNKEERLDVELIIKIWKKKLMCTLWAQQLESHWTSQQQHLSTKSFVYPIIVKENLMFQPSCRCRNAANCEDHLLREKASLKLRVTVEYKMMN